MATAAAIEVIIRARDEASAQVAATMQKITGETRSAEAALRNLGRGAGALGELAGGLAQGEASASDLLRTVGGVASFFGGPWGVAIGLGVQGLGLFVESSQKATAEQEKFTRALLGFDAGPFVAEMQKATAAGDTFAAARAKEQAELREQLAGEGSLRRVLAERAALAAQTATNMEEVEKHLRVQLQLNLEILNAERRRAEMKYLQENQPIPDSVTRTFEERGQLLEDRFARELGQRHDQAAKEQARADAQATRAAEQAAKEQAQAQIDAAEDVARAWQRSTQVRDRLGRDLTAAQRELTGAQRAQFAETVAALPGLEQERQRVAKLPWADPVRMLELQHELASLRDEAGSILKDDRRKAADERVVAAQARVDQLATDFEKAEAHAHALTEKVKELGGALKDLQTQPGFAAKLSQDLADTLEFLSARSP